MSGQCSPPSSSKKKVSGAELVARYTQFAQVIESAGITPAILRDPRDDAILACALAARADLIVSGDADLLNLKHFHGMRILNAADALALLSPGR